MKIEIEPIGFIENARAEIKDDHWGKTTSMITLTDSFPVSSLKGLDQFSHVEIIFYFHQVQEGKIVRGVRHPRNNQSWPKMGIFSQRGKNRPNRIRLTIARIIKLEGRIITVRGLNAINGTPLLDIKPVFRQFLPKEPVRQPAWVDELMGDYWEES